MSRRRVKENVPRRLWLDTSLTRASFYLFSDQMASATSNSFVEGDHVVLGALKVRPEATATVVKVHPRRLTVRLECSGKLLKVKSNNCTKPAETAEKQPSEDVSMLASPRVPSPTSIMQHAPESPPPAAATVTVASCSKEQTPSRLTTALTAVATFFGVVVGLVESRAAGVAAR